MWRDGDRLYGRGVSDMKGYLACVLACVPAMVKEPLAAPIHLAFSYDEEVGCSACMGSSNAPKRPLPPQLAVFVGEPTEMGVVGSHKGSAGLLTTVVGKACHSSRPTHGVNAIFHAMDLIAELRGYANEPLRSARRQFAVRATLYDRQRRRHSCRHGAQRRARRLRVSVGHPGHQGVVNRLVDRFKSFADTKVVPVMREGFREARVTTAIAYDVPPFMPTVASQARRSRSASLTRDE